MVAKAGVAAKITFLVHSHMLRHACGFKLANDGHDTRQIDSRISGGINFSSGLIAPPVVWRSDLTRHTPLRRRNDEAGAKQLSSSIIRSPGPPNCHPSTDQA